MDNPDLLECEKEALHLSGAIQSHGALLAVGRDGRVSHVSENIAEFLGQSPAELLGQPIPEGLAHLLIQLDKAIGERLLIESAIQTAAGWLDVVASRSESGQVLLEITRNHEPAVFEAPLTFPDAGNESDVERRIQTSKMRLVEVIATLTGAHRVMYYKFHPKGDGEVIAEVCDSQRLGSYLGLRFPASDIPQIARQLYLKNPWRLIPDIRSAVVGVVGVNAEPIDLSRSDLRSVSPIHLQYLANMGVRASLSFPVVIGDQLHALVAAHHLEPISLPVGLLNTISGLVRTFNHRLATDLSQKRMRMLDGIHRRFGPVLDDIRRHGSLGEAWDVVASALMEEFQCDGATLCLDEECISLGVRLEPDALIDFDEWFSVTQQEFVWVSDCISREVPNFPLSEVAGILAIRLGGGGVNRGHRIYLFRSEYIHEVSWGGNPNKPAEFHEGQYGIAPRRSFAKWVEKRLGYSRPWDNECRLLALKFRDLLTRENFPYR